VVFDASAKTPEGPSLNDCMHAGPSLLPNLMDILLRFRLQRVGLISDIEKAFFKYFDFARAEEFSKIFMG